jgi:hypothetical protein
MAELSREADELVRVRVEGTRPDELLIGCDDPEATTRQLSEAR